MKTLTITTPDDWHIHLRDDAALARTVPDAARQFARAIVMPNLVPPVVNVDAAAQYQQRIRQHIPEGSAFTPLMTLYMTDKTDAKIIEQAVATPMIHAVKLYPAGATTNSAAGVTDIQQIYPALEVMQKHGLPLLMHGEITQGDIFDREARFIDDVLIPLRQHFPELNIVMEHITTAEAVDYVIESKAHLAATITPHHLLFNRNQLLVGGIKPHYYCLPILKREKHQRALVQAAISGDKHFFLGTDSAPHAVNRKESACGCAGIYSAYSAIEWYASVFAANDALDTLESFASFNGPDFYGLPRNQTTITLEKTDWQIPNELSFAQTNLQPLGAGETLTWRLIDE